MTRRMAARRAVTEWARLHKAIDEWWVANRAPRERVNWARLYLISFMSWCAASHISPQRVSDGVVEKFLAQAKPKRREALLRRAWNNAVQQVNGWPAVTLSPPLDANLRPTCSRGEIVRLPKADFHPSLVAEINQFCANGGFLDPEREMLARFSHRDRVSRRLAKLYADEKTGRLATLMAKRPRTLCPSCLGEISRLLYRTASAIHIAREVNVRDLKHISDLVTPRSAAILADSIVNRLGPERSKKTLYLLYNVRWLLRIARRCGVVFSYAEQVAWNELVMDILETAPLAGGMSEKNLTLTLQLDDPDKFSMLVALPDVMMAELERARCRRGSPTLVEARRAKAVVAIDILNTFPLRRGTLVKLDVKRNFLRPRDGRAVLAIYHDQEKSRKTMEAPMTERSWNLLSLYLQHYRPLLPCAGKTTYLFPGDSRTGYTSPATFSAVISGTVRRRLGINIHVHLWRHMLANKLGELTQRPESAGALLGHVSGSRATRNYVRLSVRLATKQLGKITEGARSRGQLLLKEARLMRKRGWRKRQVTARI